jgi:hypothetical protein
MDVSRILARSSVYSILHSLARGQKEPGWQMKDAAGGEGVTGSLNQMA